MIKWTLQRMHASMDDSCIPWDGFYENVNPLNLGDLIEKIRFCINQLIISIAFHFYRLATWFFSYLLLFFLFSFHFLNRSIDCDWWMCVIQMNICYLFRFWKLQKTWTSVLCSLCVYKRNVTEQNTSLE